MAGEVSYENARVLRGVRCVRTIAHSRSTLMLLLSSGLFLPKQDSCREQEVDIFVTGCDSRRLIYAQGDHSGGREFKPAGSSCTTDQSTMLPLRSFDVTSRHHRGQE